MAALVSFHVPTPEPSLALEYLLDAAIERFGHAPRDVYTGIFQPGTEDSWQNLTHFSLKELQTLASSLARGETNRFELRAASPHIFALFPEDDEFGGGVKWKLNFKSTRVAKQYMDLLEADDDSEVCRQITFFRHLPRHIWIPQMRGIAVYLFEPLLHRMLANTATGDSWSLHAMSSANDNLTVRAIETAVPSDVQFAKVKRDVQRFRDLPKLVEQGCYYRPYAENHPFFDAFTAEINGTSAALWMIQIATSGVHRGSGVGYQMVRQIVEKLKTRLPADQPPLANVRKGVGHPSASEPPVQVGYLLVVPKGGNQQFTWTFPMGWMEDCEGHDDRGDVYCLEVPLTVRLAVIRADVTSLMVL